MSALKCRPRPSRGRDAPPSVVGSGTWQVRVSKHPGPGESQESGGGGGGWGATGRWGRLCGGRGGKWTGKGIWTEETPQGRMVQGTWAGGGRSLAGGQGMGRRTGPSVPEKGARVASRLGDTPAGSISAPAARLSPPLDPARRGGWAFCREVRGCRGSSLWQAGRKGTRA